MELAKLTVIALVLAARTCRGEIVIGTSTPDESTARLVDDLVNIVTSCYKGQINHGVGLSGNLPSTLIRRLTVQHAIPVSLINNVRNFEVKVPEADLQFRQKLNVFIIEAASWEELDCLIHMDIGKSIWWNHMASFIILDLSPGCVNLVNFLSIAWQADVLNAKVMCRDHKSGRFIFNYNPFKSQAPVPWQRDNGTWIVRKRKEKERLLTIFSQNYRENETVCENLDFEKTQDLGGYEIRLQGPSKNYTITTDGMRKRGTYAYVTTRNRILATVFRVFNATARVYGESEISSVRVDNHMCKLENWMLNTWKVGERMTTYPHRQLEDRIVTQFRGLRSQLNKVVDVFDNGSLIGMLVVYFITLIFFKFFVRQSVVQAVLNLIRMTFGMGFTNLPDNTVSRIYLASLLVFAVVMQGVFQSDTACLLTSQTPLPHANSIKDLEDLGYKQICMYPSKSNLLEGSVLEKNIDGNWDIHYCTTRVKNDSSVAFITAVEGDCFDSVEKLDLRVSTKTVNTYYLTFAIQWNYPLAERINKIISRMVEASVFESWDIKCNPIKLSDFYVDSTKNDNSEFKVLNLNDLTFAFAVLGIGLLCATSVFIIELAVGWYNVRYTCGIKIKLWCHLIPVARRDSIPTVTGLSCMGIARVHQIRVVSKVKKLDEAIGLIPVYPESRHSRIHLRQP